MKPANIRKVANAIEKHSIRGLGFNMGPYIAKSQDAYSDQSGHRCGTVACIAGTAALIAEKAASAPRSGRRIDNLGVDAHEQARGFLGLNYIDADNLFLGRNTRLMSREDIPAKAAVECLRFLARTGKVDWDRAIDKTAAPVTA